MKQLYSESSLKEKVKNIQISEQEVENAKIWIEKLKKKELLDEKRNYGKFNEYILNKILGYSVEDIKEAERISKNSECEFILLDNDKKYFCIIELKGQDTNLEKKQGGGYGKTPIEQAHYYALESNCPYFLVSDYEKFLFFETKRGKYECITIDFKNVLENNNFGLRLLKVLLSKKCLIEEKVVDKISEDFIAKQRNFSKEFYKLFHETRKMLIREIEFNNNTISREESVRYSQLILDRLIFICFAEDSERNLLESQILEKTLLNAIRDNKELWKKLNLLFTNLNIGLKDKFGEIKVPHFNGGLFKDSLENLHIQIRNHVETDFFKEDLEKYKFDKDVDKEIKEKLKSYSKIWNNFFLIATFDFTTELDVNILGHIFENSLNDLEKLQNNDKSQRKKDGIFYTPEYITEYICRNTIIPHLSEKQSKDTDELIEEYSKDTKSIEVLDEKLKNIKILDPACGSGAFLNKAVDILLEIHEKLTEVKKEKGYFKAKKGNVTLEQFSIQETIREILLNNIYGVDLNQASVEITKLSLFLKVATVDKPLPALDENIKCGNSLISGINEKSLIDYKEEINDLIQLKKNKSKDYEIEKNILNRKINKNLKEYFGEDYNFVNPFNWEVEFAEIMQNGGFDIVIGNPPYVRMEKIDTKSKIFLKQKYSTATGRIDLYSIFIEKAIYLMKKESNFSFIIPNTLLNNDDFSDLRQKLILETKITKINILGSNVFESATVSSIILNFTKGYLDKNKTYYNYNKTNLNYINGYELQETFLKYDKFRFTFVNNNIKLILEKIYSKGERIEKCLNYISGIQIWGDKKDKEQNLDLYSNIQLSLEYKKTIIGENIEKYYFKFKDDYILYDKKRLNRGREEINFLQEDKVIMRYIGNKIICSYDNKKYYVLKSVIIFYPLDRNKLLTKYILILMNSFLFQKLYDIKVGNEPYPRINLSYLLSLPIPKISLDEQKPFIEKADLMIELNKDFYEKRQKFLDRIRDNLNLDKISKNLDEFYNLDFKSFLKELEKQKIKLSLKDQDSWQEYFSDYKKELIELKAKIDKTDREIDKMVYKLYDLTEDEIKIVEESLK